MSRRICKSHQRCRCALSLEMLEDRIALSGWSLPAAATAPSWKAAIPTPVASTSTPPSWNVSSSASYSGEQDNYVHQTAAASTDWSDTPSTTSPTPATVGQYSHTATATTSSPPKSATVSSVDYGGGGYVAAAASSSGAGSESAFSYYGQQPFYRLPPDQISAYRASGEDMPQSASDNPALLAIVANQDGPNSAGHPTTADTAARRNADVLVVMVSARPSADQHIALEAGRFVALAAAEARGPVIVPAVEAESNSLVAPLTLGLLPSSGKVAAGMLPVDLEALERGVEQFFGQMATLGDHVSGGEAAQRLTPWLVAVALSTAALETARWRFWKPAPGTPAIARTTRGFSTTHPRPKKKTVPCLFSASGTDPFPDAS